MVGWTGQNNPPATVLAAFRPGDGPFGPVEFLTTTGNGENPRFSFEPDGTVLAVWSHATIGAPGGFATRPRSGVFSVAQSLPTGDRFAEVGIDGSGTALVVWKSVAMANHVVVAAGRPAGGIVQTPVPVSGPATDAFMHPRVAVNAGGEAVVAWQRDAAAGASALEARIGTVTGPAFGALQPLASETSADEGFSEPEVAIAPSGEAIVVWTHSVGGVSRVEFAVRPAGAASFGSVETLAQDAFGPMIAMDALGAAVIGFAKGPAGALVPSAVVRPPGGVPGAPAPLGPPASSNLIASVSFDASGAALVAWTRSLAPGSSIAEAARRPSGGAFGPVARIADLGAGGRLSVAAEPDGDAVAAWRIPVSLTEVVLRVGGLDFTPDPPALAGRPVPSPAVPRFCDGRLATIAGTAGADRLRGTPGRDVIAGLGGADVIRGLGGADVICGGAGRDRLLGGLGRDRLLGGPQADRLLGGGGADRLLGGTGRDRLEGGPGADRLLGGSGVDFLLGGLGRDALLGGLGRNTLRP